MDERSTNLMAGDSNLAASTPDAGAPAAATADTTTKPDATAAAPASLKAGLSVYDQLAAGEKPDAIRQERQEATPPATTQSATKPAAGKDASQPADANRGKAAPLAEYGMDEANYRVLNRTGTLPTPDEWRLLPPTARGQLVSAAKTIQAAKTRAYQASQAAAQATNHSDDLIDPNGDDEQLDGAGEAGADETLARSGQQRQRPASRSQAGQPPAAGKAEGKASAAEGKASAADADDDEPLLAEITDYFGGDATLSDKFKGVLSGQKQRFQQQLQERDRQFQEFIADHFGAQADAAFDELAADEVPELKDEAQRAAVLPLAVSLFKTARESGKRISLAKAVKDAARAHFLPDLQQRAQSKLVENRSRTLAGTPARLGGHTAPERGMSVKERELSIYEQLEAGKRPDEARAAHAI